MNQLRAPEQGARNSRCSSFPIFVEFLSREQAQRVLLIKLSTLGVLNLTHIYLIHLLVTDWILGEEGF